MCNFNGYLSGTSRSGKSSDSYHTITSVYVDICPPNISVERKQSQQKRPCSKGSSFHLYFFGTEEKRTRFVDSSDIKKLVAGQHSFLRAVFSRSGNKREGYNINKPFSGLLVCRFMSVQKRVNSVQRSITNQTFWLVNKQRNSLTANQVRALDVASFGCSENLRAKQWQAFWLGFLSPLQQQYLSWKTASTMKTL